MTGLGKPQLHAKFEVAGFIYYGNVREFVFKRQWSYSLQITATLQFTTGVHIITLNSALIRSMLAGTGYRSSDGDDDDDDDD